MFKSDDLISHLENDRDVTWHLSTRDLEVVVKSIVKFFEEKEKESNGKSKQN